jgi:phosphopantetheinyl transferase (holo-ACP synthase)
MERQGNARHAMAWHVKERYCKEFHGKIRNGMAWRDMER